MKPLARLSAGAALAGLMALPLAAQTFGLDPGEGEALPDFSQNAQEEVLGGGYTAETITLSPGASSAPRGAPVVATESAGGAVLRGLDKITGETEDLELGAGERTEFGRLTVELGECRYPRDNPAGDAYALLTITTDTETTPWFRGWMIASSPALSALDHPRYDVWVMRCRSS